MLVAAVEHGGVGRRPQGGADEPGRRPECLDQRVRVLRVEPDAGQLLHPGEECPNGRCDLQRPGVRPDPGHGLAEPGDRVVVVDLRPVPGATVRHEPEPADPLLRGLEQVCPPAADHRREAADLADRLADALDQVGPLVDDPGGAVVPTCLLVREERHDQVARRALAGAHQVADGREDHGVHVLHVDGAAAPDAVVDHIAGERVDLPVVGAGGDDVQVPVHEQGGAGGIGARDPREDVRPLRPGLDQLGLETDLAQQARDQLGGLALARPGVVPVVRGVDGDEVPADVDDLVLGRRLGARGGLGHGVSRRTRRRWLDASLPRRRRPARRRTAVGSGGRHRANLFSAAGPMGPGTTVRVAELADALA